MNQTRLLVLASVSGACVMAVEIAGSRILAPYLGTTIYTWAAVIGLVMAALSLGYYFGGRLADRYNDQNHLGKIFFLAAFATLAIPVLGKVIVPFMILLPLWLASILSALILVPASFFYGMVSPYVIKLVSKEENVGSSSGQVFSVSTLGSIIGTLGTGFILVPNISLSLIFIGAALAMIFAGWSIGKKLNHADLLIFFMFAVPSTLVGFAFPFGGNTIYQASSEYYLISVIDNFSYGNGTARVLVLDNALSSGEDSDGNPVFNYARQARTAYNLSKNPKTALVVGVGAGTQVEDLKRYYPLLSVDGVEIDQKVIDVAYAYFNLKKDSRTNIIIDDARRYIKTTNRAYDLVILDVFRGTSIPYHLTSKEFLHELKSRTNPDAVVIANIIATPKGEKSLFLELIYNTFSAEFKNVLLIPIGNNPEELQNVMLVATDSDVRSFSEKHSPILFQPDSTTGRTITDEQNPMDVLVQ